MSSSFSGLPSVGKTTIAKQLAKIIHAVFLRVDTIEQPIIKTYKQSDIGPIGYEIMANLASENIRLGLTVIVDCVNLLEISRQLFHTIASRFNVRIFDIEVQSQDSCEHKKRLMRMLALLSNI